MAASCIFLLTVKVKKGYQKKKKLPCHSLSSKYGTFRSSLRRRTSSQFESTQKGGISLQGHVGCGPGDQQLQVVSFLQLHDT